ncbi:MAG: D-alanyl-D-alanine carboxypeptidase/D-alanyl-D-alanine-endopeptidase [Armatimonadetes bacterium]|nr:D-alanyl-D-alanine carboxypeptidase/D-alanyl-D-alanine-endopeptidase [Armatimonadota bacterium]
MHRVSASFAFFLVLSALHAQSLQAEIDALLNVEWLRYGYCGVAVRDLQTGETLYTRDAERVLIPASNMKLLVSAAALHRLGPDYRFRTRVWMRGTLLPDGTLQGDLILQGLGDATLEMRGLETLAQQVRQAGVQRVQGYLLYDDSWLDAERYGFGWSSDDEPFGYQAQMSALCAERNAIRLYAKPATQVGEPAQLRLEPATDYVELVNRTRTVERGAANTGIRATRTRARNQIIVDGTLPLGSEEVFVGRYAVENPSRYAAHLFRQALQAAGVVVERGVVPALTPCIPLSHRAGEGECAPLSHLVGEGLGVRTDKSNHLTLLAEHLSPPLHEVVALINKPSDNLITEITLKTLGKEIRGAGTTAAGVQVLREFLQSAGLEMGAVHIVDGSGLSRINGVSPENFVRLLEYMHRSPHAEAFRESLPVYGVDGTLRNRLRGTPVQGNGYAKTGSLNRVSSLSGYLRTKSGRWLAFSVIMNAYNASGADARALQDKLVQMLWERL